MGRMPVKKQIAGRFAHIPLSVIQTVEFSSLSHAAVRLLLLIAAGYTGRNNGQLVACRKSLARFGWRSADSTTRCLRQLENSGLIVQTRIGMRPNRAAWFAIAWRELDIRVGIEIDPNKYRKFVGTPLCPLIGADSRRIGPAIGQRHAPAAPMTGAIGEGKSQSFARSPERI